jgi:hypothetical protein
MEAFLHTHLKEYRKKNEFFKVSISLIENGAKLFAETNGPQFFHEDVILVNAEFYDVQYISSKNIFLFTDHQETTHSPKGLSRIKHADEFGMRTVVLDWLSCVDTYKLVRYMSTDTTDRLVTLLKQACISKQESVNEIDLSADLRRLKL